jgi:ribosome-associated protein
MDIRKLQRAIVDGLEDVKAQDIAVFNTEAMSPLFERVIIASGTSNRQTKALAASVRDTVKQRGMQVLRTEGEDNGEWIIVDCGAAVAHIMQPAIREYYHLEEIWGDKPVRMKVAAAARGLPKASEPPPPAPAKPSAKASARPPRGTSARRPAKTSAKTPAKASSKAAAKTSKRAPAKASAKTSAKAPAKPAAKVAAKVAAKTSARKTAARPVARKPASRA